MHTMLKATVIVGAFLVLQAGGIERDVEEVTEKQDREFLSPNYKDPEVSREKPKQELVPGVVDVSAEDGFPFRVPHFPNLFDLGKFGHGNTNGMFDLAGLFNTFGGFDEPWWKGENVCVEREETSTKSNATSFSDLFSASIKMSSCEESPNRYQCTTRITNGGVTKSSIVTYKCCYGFKRNKLRNLGCADKIDLVPVLDVIEKVEASDFKLLIELGGLKNKFLTENVTVLVPSNEALGSFADNMNLLNQIEITRRRRQQDAGISEQQLVLNHVIRGYTDLTNIKNNQILFSEGNNTIRFNVYPSRNDKSIVTANCAVVNEEVNLATNGIVHTIEGVIKPLTRSLSEIVAEHPNLTYFHKALQNSNSAGVFKPDTYYTVFAPTDDAFNRLEATDRNRILDGVSCADKILKHHISPNSICLAGIVGQATTRNMNGYLISLNRGVNGDVTFGDHTFEKADILASNGVIHLIDGMTIPDIALLTTQSLKKERFTVFGRLLQEEGLTDINAMKNVTIFAPTDKAFNLMDNDKSKLKRLLLNHITVGALESRQMSNGMRLLTKNNETLLLNLYTTMGLLEPIINRATVNCVPLTGYDEISCKSVIHEVGGLLNPAKQTMWEVINDRDVYSTLRKLIKRTELENVLKDGGRSLTFLAPTNEAFDKLGNKFVENLLADKERASKVLMEHVLTEVLCCTGIGSHTWGFTNTYATLGRSRQTVSNRGKYKIGGATITECDIVATNGVVHSINKLLIPDPSHGYFFDQ